MSYTYAPPRGFAVALGLGGAYTPPRGFAVPLSFRPPTPDPVANDDAYAVGRNVPLYVVSPGVLTNDVSPGGTALEAHLGVTTSHGTLVLQSDGAFSYTPATNFLGVDTFTYYVTDEDGGESDLATVTITVSRVPVTRYTHLATALPWALQPRKRAVDSLPCRRASMVRRMLETAWQPAAQIRAHAAMSFRLIDRVQYSDALPFSHAAPVRVATPAIAWPMPPRLRASVCFDWGMPSRVAAAAAMLFDAPPRLRVDATMHWQVPPRLRAAASLPFHAPPRVKRTWWLPWGLAPRVAWVVRGPGTDTPPVRPPQPGYDPGRGFAIAINFACLQPVVRGFAVPIRFGECYCARPQPGTIIVLNTASVITTVTRQEIEVTSIDIAESIDSLHHTFSITLAQPDDLAWLTPSAGVPIAVEININGYLRTGIVESWETQYQFPGRSVSVSGRALTALLDAPNVDVRAYTSDAEYLASQLVDRELTDSGFSADYAAGVDWLIPAGVWTYASATPVAAIQTLAAASGAVARSHPWDKIIEILPRWPVSPWAWDTATPDVTIAADYVPQLTARDATSGIATYEAQLPLFVVSDATKPGLLRPGQLVEFSASSGWRAQVSQVRISAQAQQGGGASTLVVWQTVTLEAPEPEPRYNSVLVSGQQVGVSDPIIRDGSDGAAGLPQIVDALIVTHPVALERGRNAIAGGGDKRAAGNVWRMLLGTLPQSRLIKGNVTTANPDGSYTIATSDGATIRARPQPGKTWSVLDGVFVRDGVIVDAAPSLPGTTQYV